MSFRVVERTKARGGLPLGYKAATWFGGVMGAYALAVLAPKLGLGDAALWASALGGASGLTFAVGAGLGIVMRQTRWGARPLERADLEPRHVLHLRSSTDVATTTSAVARAIRAAGAQVTSEALGEVHGEREEAAIYGYYLHASIAPEGAGCAVRIDLEPRLSVQLADDGRGRELRDRLERALVDGTDDDASGISSARMARAIAQAHAAPTRVARKPERPRVSERAGSLLHAF